MWWKILLYMVVSFSDMHAFLSGYDKCFRYTDPRYLSLVDARGKKTKIAEQLLWIKTHILVSQLDTGTATKSKLQEKKKSGCSKTWTQRSPLQSLSTKICLFMKSNNFLDDVTPHRPHESFKWLNELVKAIEPLKSNAGLDYLFINVLSFGKFPFKMREHPDLPIQVEQLLFWKFNNW